MASDSVFRFAICQHNRASGQGRAYPLRPRCRIGQPARVTHIRVELHARALAVRLHETAWPFSCESAPYIAGSSGANMLILWALASLSATHAALHRGAAHQAHQGGIRVPGDSGELIPIKVRILIRPPHAEAEHLRTPTPPLLTRNACALLIFVAVNLNQWHSREHAQLDGAPRGHVGA